MRILGVSVLVAMALAGCRTTKVGEAEFDCFAPDVRVVSYLDCQAVHVGDHEFATDCKVHRNDPPQCKFAEILVRKRQEKPFVIPEGALLGARKIYTTRWEGVGDNVGSGDDGGPR